MPKKSAAAAQVPNWIGEMHQAFIAGEFEHAVHLYDDYAQAAGTPLEAVLLRARIYTQTDLPGALKVLIDNPPRSEDAAPLVAQREMLLALAYALLGQPDLAAEHTAAAEAIARREDDAELLGEIAYWRAWGFLSAGQADAAEALLPQVARTGSEQSRLFALSLRNFVLARRENFRDQAAVLVEFVALLNEAPTDNVRFRAWMTESLAVLAREMYLPQARGLIEASLAKPWPVAFRANRFQTLKALGWCCALQGDYFNAFRHLKAASQSAQEDPAWRTVALLDRAQLAARVGEVRWSRQELAEAEEAAHLVDWTNVKGEERIAPLQLAELFAPFDRGKAIYYLSVYEQIPPVRDKRLNTAHDRRFSAFADYSAALVHLSLGHKAKAVDLLKKNVAMFAQFGYQWRSGRAALDLYEITHDRSHLKTARDALKAYGSSWLGERLRALDAAATFAHLTPMQAKIFELLAQGTPTDAIASELGRSVFTIRNHIKAIFKAAGVNSRTALLARASRRERGEREAG